MKKASVTGDCFPVFLCIADNRLTRNQAKKLVKGSFQLSNDSLADILGVSKETKGAIL